MARLTRLLSPWNIGKLRLKNRMVMSPMTTVWADPDETPSDRQIAYWIERAKGGVGLIITEVNSIDPLHRYQPLSVGLHSDYQIERHKALTDAVHAAGAKIFPQISHPGPESLAPFLENTAAIGPSVNRSESTGQVCRELDVEELPAIIEMYGEAARRAREAGYDGVELHMAHNYMLLGSFLSPLRNKREDEYAGHTIVGRVKLCVEAIRKIKEKAGRDYPLTVRISGDECVGGANGRDMTDTQRIAPLLEAAGVDCIHVSGGVIDPLVTQIIAGTNYDYGYNVSAGHTIKEVVHIPVMPVGCIHDPLLAEKILAKGRADAIVMGRPFLADSELPKKVQEGRLDDIRHCIRCLTCVDSLMKLEDLHCAVNGRMGKEELYPLHGKAEKMKKVMVVGSGPGGMEAARVAAERGHRVTLYDKHLRLGGSLVTACTVHADNETLLDYLVTQIRKLPVAIVLGVEVTPEFVKQEQPDVLIDASGGMVVAPQIPGDDLPHVITGTMMHTLLYGELPLCDLERVPWWMKLGIKHGGPLMQRVITPQRIRLATKLWTPLIGAKVVFVGADLAAIESAEFLAQRDREVTVIDSCEELAPEIGAKRRYEHIERMRKLGITLHTDCEVKRITRQGVFFKPHYSDREFMIKADTVILAGEIKPKTELYDACKAFVPEAYMIGDISGLGLIDKAIQEANAVIYGLG